MSKNISVKVPVAKVVAALEAKVKASKAALAEIKKIRNAHKTAHEKWEVAFAKAVVKAGTITGANVDRWYNPTKYSVNVNVPEGTVLPEKPEMPDLPVCDLGAADIEEAENAIRILKMTEDEYVSASVFKNLSRFL